MLKVQKWVVNPCQECTHVVSDETGEAILLTAESIIQVKGGTFWNT